MKSDFRRLQRLEDRIGLKDLLAREAEAKLRQKARDNLVEQFFDLLEDALPAFDEADQERLAPEQGEENELFANWSLRMWLDTLLDGSTQLPALSPETANLLFRAWLQPRVWYNCYVCLSCGLCRPAMDAKEPPWKVLPGKVPFEGPPLGHDKLDFFQGCPHCGSTKYTWAHLNRPERRHLGS